MPELAQNRRNREMRGHASGSCQHPSLDYVLPPKSMPDLKWQRYAADLRTRRSKGRSLFLEKVFLYPEAGLSFLAPGVGGVFEDQHRNLKDLEAWIEKYPLDVNAAG